MAAPRKHSDAQRAAIWDLDSAGNTAAAIARRCSAGLASVARFEIPARSVRQILSDMKKERGVKPLHALADLDDVDAIDAQPWRAFRIAKRVFDRAEAKPAPTLRDLEQLEHALKVLALAKRALRAAPLRTAPGRRPPDRETRRDDPGPDCERNRGRGREARLRGWELRR